MAESRALTAETIGSIPTAASTLPAPHTPDVEVVTRFKQPRLRSPAHLAWLRRLPCCIPGCRGKPTIAHHLTCGPEPKARGLKASDRYAVNLCETIHHSAQSQNGVHHQGDERAWWQTRGIDPIALADFLWARSSASKETSRCQGRLR